MSLKSVAKDCDIESNISIIISEEPLSIEMNHSIVTDGLRGKIKRTVWAPLNY